MRIITLALICMVAFAACNATEEQIDCTATQARFGIPPGENPITSFAMEAAPLIAPNREDAPTDIARGANDFAFALGAALLQNHNPNESIVVSPFSVWMLLAALLNATDEAYQAAHSEAIGTIGASPDEVNQAVSRMMFDLTGEHGRQSGWEGFEEHRLHIANAIFVDYNNPIHPDFAQVFLDYYRGHAMNIDFSSPYAVAAVNAWASANTNGLINDIVQEFAEDVVAALVNAIYFSDRWSAQFNPNNTRQDIFHSPTGEVLAYFMERQMFNVMHFDDGYAQSVTLWFESGGGLTIILPHDGDAISLLAGMDSAYLDRISEESVRAEGRFVLPRFRIENRLDDSLTDALIYMGVPLFCEDSAPLGNRLVEADMPVFLTEAVQVAVIEADEEGLVAAAVTVILPAPESAPVPEELRVFEMICDTPFVFVLHRWVTDGGRQVLFTGVVNRP